MECKKLGICCTTDGYYESNGERGSKCTHLKITGKLGELNSTECLIWEDRPFCQAVECIDKNGDICKMMACQGTLFPDFCCGGLDCNKKFS